MLDVLQDLNWPGMDFFVTLLVALAVLVALVSVLEWYIRGRKQRREEKQFSNLAPPPMSSVRRVPRHSTEEQAYRLFEAIYELAEGNPEQWVAGPEAAERAGIPFTPQNYDPLFRYLKQSGLITTENLVHNQVCKLTLKGVRVMERVANPVTTPDSVYSPKG
jgi:hypothetical protein